MAILNSTGSKSIHGRISYLFETAPHSTAKVTHRNLAVDGNNIRLLTDNTGIVSRYQDGYYLERQMHRILKKAKNPKRKYQLQSIIISFGTGEFDLKNKDSAQRKEIVQQALQLVKGFALLYFGDAQFVISIQSDGLGGMLHAHLLVNAIKPNGKTVQLNLFKVFALRRRLNNYLQANFPIITGREWNSGLVVRERNDIDDIFSTVKWINALKAVINDAKSRSFTFTQFKMKLIRHHVGLKIREKGIIYTIKFDGKKYQIRDFKQLKDKKGTVLVTKGLGKRYTLKEINKYFENRRDNKKE